jgi:plastocyanin
VTTKLHPLRILLLLLIPLTANSATVDVTLGGLSFSPSVINIDEGDTVRWNLTGGIHTVTNGTSTSDPNLGDLFDEAMNDSNTTFSFTFPTAGTYPYLCRPHADFGMTGTINVAVVETHVYVDAAHTGEEVGTESNPFKTLAAAVAAADSGATIHIAPGAYVELFNGASALSSAASFTTNGSGTVRIGAVFEPDSRVSGFQTRSIPLSNRDSE